ncbi:hypothetical protein [Nitrosomonas sp.]|uniref:hypothetical protein n=1 Tax=Nitrosomonas sp. TaxID=42353 RepID=UPI0025CDDDE0|nr:hypothetical protein [Nitrosomonas sp.]
MAIRSLSAFASLIRQELYASARSCHSLIASTLRLKFSALVTSIAGDSGFSPQFAGDQMPSMSVPAIKQS